VRRAAGGPQRGRELDALLAHVLGDRLLVGVDVLVEADAFLGYGARVDDRLVGVERDLVLSFGDLGAR
jgi:hypothetical protein